MSIAQDKDNFRKWFVLPLQTLNENEHAGFAVLMVAFPLLERYLREKSGVGEDRLDEKFYDEFHFIFNEPKRTRVKDLWRSCPLCEIGAA